MKEGGVDRGFYTIVVSIHSDKPRSRRKSNSSNVKNVSGKTGRGKSGKRSKSFWTIFRLSWPRQKKEIVMVHRVHKNVSNEVRLAHDCPKMDDGSFNQKKRNLGAYANGSWPAAILTILVMKSVCISRVMLRIPLTTRFVWIFWVALRFLLSTTRMSVTHAAFLVESEVFKIWTLV